MSRRLKLLIPAILLLALEIAAVDISLNWSPANPLRFRLYDLRPSKEMPDVIKEFSLDIENTSTATIYLYRAELVGPENPEGHADSVGGIDLQEEEEPEGTDDGIRVIPPRSTRRFTVSMFEISAARPDLARARVAYTAASRARHHALAFMDYLDREWPSIYDRLSKLKYPQESVTPMHAYQP